MHLRPDDLGANGAQELRLATCAKNADLAHARRRTTKPSGEEGVTVTAKCTNKKIDVMAEEATALRTRNGR